TAVIDTADNASPTRLAAWQALGSEARRLAKAHVTELYDADPERFARFSFTSDGLLADFSKQRIDDAVLRALLRLADEAGVASAARALVAGASLYSSAGRPALHLALRGSAAVPPDDAATLADTTARMRAFARDLREGRVAGAGGEPIRRVINLGIGGSDFGPRVAFEALRDPTSTLPVAVDFVASIDPCALDAALATADPRTTLFIVSSKSFSTPETLANAETARDWLRAGLGENADIAAHFAAVSNRAERAAEFGIAAERIFAVPDWVGGRYSVWS